MGSRGASLHIENHLTKWHLVTQLLGLGMLQNGAEDLLPSKYTQTAAAIRASDFPSMNARLATVLDALAAKAVQ
jgi:hypothetical protein